MAMIKVLNDDSPMPFGKHRGKKMADVPAGYLLWFRDTTPLPEHGSVTVYNTTFHGPLADRVRAEQNAVRAYIADNLDVLLSEQKKNFMFNPYK